MKPIIPDSRSERIIVCMGTDNITDPPIAGKRIFDREFYSESAVGVAKKLLGAVLICDSPEGAVSGRIVETEAYAGRNDAACHSYGRTAPSGHRTDVMFGPGGFAYVYLIYGMYNCFNVVANVTGEPEAVLIRAVEPTGGIQLPTLAVIKW